MSNFFDRLIALEKVYLNLVIREIINEYLDLTKGYSNVIDRQWVAYHNGNITIIVNLDDSIEHGYKNTIGMIEIIGIIDKLNAKWKVFRLKIRYDDYKNIDQIKGQKIPLQDASITNNIQK